MWLGCQTTKGTVGLENNMEKYYWLLTYQLVFDKKPIFPIEFEIETLRTTQEFGLDLTEAQINWLQQINELDEIRLSALQNTTLIQQ